MDENPYLTRKEAFLQSATALQEAIYTANQALIDYQKAGENPGRFALYEQFMGLLNVIVSCVDTYRQTREALSDYFKAQASDYPLIQHSPFFYQPRRDFINYASKFEGAIPPLLALELMKTEDMEDYPGLAELLQNNAFTFFAHAPKPSTTQ